MKQSVHLRAVIKTALPAQLTALCRHVRRQQFVAAVQDIKTVRPIFCTPHKPNVMQRQLVPTMAAVIKIT